jgi:transcriptional regulator with XRE-family HTH domain
VRLGALLHAWRQKNDLTLRSIADEIGVAASTLCRLENGKTIDAASFAKILLWLIRPKD